MSIGSQGLRTTVRVDHVLWRRLRWYLNEHERREGVRVTQGEVLLWALEEWLASHDDAP